MYEFNLEETKKLQNKSVFLQFKKWLHKNGVILHPSVIYPAYFGEKGKGVVGVASSAFIQTREAIIAIPYHLLITAGNIRRDKKLERVIKENPKIFKVDEEASTSVLILFVCLELMKKGESFYAPYFAISADITLGNWSQMDMAGLQNQQIVKEMKEEKEALQGYFMEFLPIFRRYPQIFNPQISNIEYKNLFDRAYSFVCTRGFGWSLPSLSLIPMADCLNHANEHAKHFIVDVHEQLKPHPSYICKHKKFNLDILKEGALKLSEKDLTEVRKKKKTRKQKFIEKHKEILKEKVKDEHLHILYQQYRAEVHNLRQLHFYDTSCSEDNDTDEEALDNLKQRKQKYKFYEKYERKNIDEKNKKHELRRYWQLYLDNDEDEQQVQEKIQKQIKKEIMVKEEGKNFAEKEGNSSRGSSEVSSTESSSEEEEYDWMKEKEDSKGTYFVMTTYNQVQPQGQIFNFYGSRSNKFLLQNYNFVLEDNKYDSYTFRLNVNEGKVPISKLVETGKKGSNLIKQIKIKSQFISIDLINHCRALLLSWNKTEEFNNVRITIPFSLEFQKKVLSFASQIIKHLLSQYMTTIEEDQELLEKTVKPESTSAILLKIGHKNILKQQLKLIVKCQEMLKLWKGGRLAIKEEDMKILKQIRHYFVTLERGQVEK